MTGKEGLDAGCHSNHQAGHRRTMTWMDEGGVARSETAEGGKGGGEIKDEEER